ncbi:MAG: hypothetical protein KKH04_08080 [Proteobacteria bacterium]|nr:hypothetical protein [Pseudomonadota bacterium]
MRIIFAIYAIGFLYGTKNHIEDILRDGLLGYHYVPFPVNLYWTLLTVLDPLAIIFLVFLPFWGMTLSVWIMATDIAVNLSVAWYYDWPAGIFTDGRLGLQIAFGLFVFFTVPLARRRIKKVMSSLPTFTLPIHCKFKKIGKKLSSP